MKTEVIHTIFIVIVLGISIVSLVYSYTNYKETCELFEKTWGFEAKVCS